MATVSNTESRPSFEHNNNSNTWVDQKMLSNAEELFAKGQDFLWKECNERAISYLQQAADLGYPPSFVRLHILYKSMEEKIFENKNTERSNKYRELAMSSKEWLIQQALTGNATSLYHAGLHFDLIEKDCEQALHWFHNSADQNYGPSHAAIGWCFYNGEGVAKNSSQAIEWFRKALDAGYMAAASLIAMCYENGEGVPVDKTQSFELYSKCAEWGHLMSQNKLADMYARGTGVEINDVMAMYWLHKAAEQGCLQAQVDIADHYHDEEPQDLENAIYWYQKAAEQDSGIAFYQLAEYSRQGKLHKKKDFATLFHWYQTAAHQGVAEAQAILGEWYYYGKGVKRDINTALKWLSKQPQYGTDMSLYLLGVCYEFGEGVPQNLETARNWYWDSLVLERGHLANMALKRIRKVYAVEKNRKQESVQFGAC